MPTSEIDLIPTIIKIVKNLNPTSILDIGIGFGKYGFLLREYLDVHKLCNGFSNNLSDNFRTRIDGIEIYAKYISQIQRNIYDQIYIGNASEIIDSLESYEIILLLDVIEHLSKKEGENLLKKLSRKASKALIVSTPPYNYEQCALYNNCHETHKSVWIPDDFKEYKNKKYKLFGGITLLVVISDNYSKNIPSSREKWFFEYLLKEIIVICAEILSRISRKIKLMWKTCI